MDRLGWMIAPLESVAQWGELERFAAGGGRST
jgi:hypothetical protein